MTTRELPKLAHRFTQLQLSLLRDALRPVNCACAQFINEFVSNNDRPEPDFDAAVLHLHGSVTGAATSSSQKRRLRLNVVETALLACSLRLARKSGSPGTEFSSPNISRTLRALHKKLENIRRRGRKATERLLGPERYRAFWNQWRSFCCWLRKNLSERRLHVTDYLLRFHKRLVNQSVNDAMRGLTAVGRETPPPTELRRLVRLALRYVRQGRTRIGIPGLVREPARAAAFFADFVAARWSSADGIHRVNA